MSVHGLFDNHDNHVCGSTDIQITACFFRSISYRLDPFLGYSDSHLPSFGGLFSVVKPLDRESTLWCSTAKCNINAVFFNCFYWKCRKHGEFPLKNDDFVLKRGRLFCNSRYQLKDFMAIQRSVGGATLHVMSGAILRHLLGGFSRGFSRGFLSVCRCGVQGLGTVCLGRE